MVYVTGDEEAIRFYEMRQMGLSDYNGSINYAIEKGHNDILEMLDQGLTVEEIKRRLAKQLSRQQDKM